MARSATRCRSTNASSTSVLPAGTDTARPVGEPSGVMRPPPPPPMPRGVTLAANADTMVVFMARRLTPNASRMPAFTNRRQKSFLGTVWSSNTLLMPARAMRRTAVAAELARMRCSTAPSTRSDHTSSTASSLVVGCSRCTSTCTPPTATKICSVTVDVVHSCCTKSATCMRTTVATLGCASRRMAGSTPTSATASCRRRSPRVNRFTTRSTDARTRDDTPGSSRMSTNGSTPWLGMMVSRPSGLSSSSRDRSSHTPTITWSGSSCDSRAMSAMRLSSLGRVRDRRTAPTESSSLLIAANGSSSSSSPSAACSRIWRCMRSRSASTGTSVVKGDVAGGPRAPSGVRKLRVRAVGGDEGGGTAPARPASGALATSTSPHPSSSSSSSSWKRLRRSCESAPPPPRATGLRPELEVGKAASPKPSSSSSLPQPASSASPRAALNGPSSPGAGSALATSMSPQSSSSASFSWYRARRWSWPRNTANESRVAGVAASCGPPNASSSAPEPHESWSIPSRASSASVLSPHAGCDVTKPPPPRKLASSSSPAPKSSSSSDATSRSCGAGAGAPGCGSAAAAAAATTAAGCCCGCCCCAAAAWGRNLSCVALMVLVSDSSNSSTSAWLAGGAPCAPPPGPGTTGCGMYMSDGRPCSGRTRFRRLRTHCSLRRALADLRKLGSFLKHNTRKSCRESEQWSGSGG